MALTSQPFERKCDSKEGRSWRIFAATALLVKIRHHDVPSIGPALTSDRKDIGISASIDWSRAVDSMASLASWARVGESWVA